MAGIFDKNSFLNYRGNLWYQPDLGETITAQIACTAERPEATISGSFTPPTITAEFAGTMEAFDVIPWSGGSNIRGDLAASFESHTLQAAGTFTEPIPPITAGLQASFDTWALSLGVGNKMVCTFQLPTIEINQEVNMATMELTFKEPRLYAVGQASYASLEASAEKMSMQAHAGSYLKAKMRRPDGNFTAVVGQLADMKARMKRLGMEAYGGPPPHIDASFSRMTMTGQSNSEILGGLKLTLRKPTASFQADVENVATMTVRMRPLTARVNAFGDRAGAVGNIKASLARMRMSATTVRYTTADLDATLLKMQLASSLYVSGPNEVDLEFDPPAIELGIDEGSCELAEIQEYEGF